MPETPPPPRTRAEPREVVELKQLKTTQPELASAVDMQLALIDMQRRVQGRVPLPWIQTDAAWLKSQHAAGRAVVRFGDIPIEWSDFRLTLRQTADILRRFDALEPADYQAIVGLGRDNRLEAIVAQWYDATSGVNGGDARSRLPDDAPAALDQVLVLAIRPFLARCAEVLMQRADLPPSTLGHCPYCGWEPDLAVITPAASRLLICGRCLAHWAFEGFTCPFCSNDDRGQITSFASRDGRYRVYACDVCRRYLKAYDSRHATRPVLVAVDTIATLPLDAAAIQRGYVG
jgi:Protein involved in formate dehydrogenase formation